MWTKAIADPLLSNCEFSAISEPMSASDVLDFYDRLRGYVEHEDDLINSRLTWSFTVHGFLFAVYGILWGRIADLFLKLHEVAPPLPAAQVPAVPAHALELVIALLFLAQGPITIVGALVGWHSLKAIVAAHKAIQHLDLIAVKSPALSVQGRFTESIGPVTPGVRSISWKVATPVKLGQSLLVSDLERTIEEVVQVASVSDAGFVAAFTRGFPADAFLTPLHSALLPRITRGGAATINTEGARSYYFALPEGAFVIWLMLGAVSLGLFVAWLVIILHSHK